MITKNDESELRLLQKHIEKSFLLKDNVQQEYIWIELIDKVIENLKNSKNYFNLNNTCDYYSILCDDCGWWGSSEFLNGGGQIADTGDFGDCYCPICNSTNFNEIEK